MRSPITAPRHLVALALSAAMVPGLASAQEVVVISSSKTVKALPVRAPLESAEATFTDVALYLIGAPDTESLGVTIRATVVPKLELTGKEKAVLYLYASCDDAPPAQSGGLLVATHELADLAVGQAPRTIITTGTVSALVPLSSVACAKLAVVCKECIEAAPPPAAYSIRRLDPVLDPGVQDVALDAPSLALVGELESKSFGIAFRGTLQPTVELMGDEKPVIRLYTGCAGGSSVGPEATNVAMVELGGLRRDSGRQRLTVTKDVTAFVPMKDIGCALVDME